MTPKRLTLNTEQLTHLEQLAGLHFPIADIAAIMSLDAESLKSVLTDPSSPITQAHRRGALRSEAELRAAILKEAKSGNPAAQKQMLNLIQTTRMKDRI